ncbi:MAG: AAA-associated domain-containing protein [Proteobacteria bacterium]|jgi:NitT/TauT family transport system ATP-binding protein|nr:AAA-associated domain-containing protein [Pseudomonadota bacterium]
MENHTESPKLDLDPLPQSGISEILGLLEILDDHKGRAKSYDLARELKMDTGDLLTTIQAAELIGFLRTPGADVIISDLGKQMIESDMNTKKQLLLEQLRKIALFKNIKNVLENQDERRMPKDKLIEQMQQIMPTEKAEEQFDTLINWGRWGEFLGYSQDDDFVYLDQG